jgi:multiple sugar transport system ATP-binding protein
MAKAWPTPIASLAYYQRSKADTPMAHVELKNVIKSYDGQNKVLHGINLTISDGQFVVLVGPSGCGKSTLLRMVAGLETVTQGEILIDGVRINDLPPRDRDIAMVFQDYALYPHKSLFENMAFGLRLRKEPEAVIQQRVMDAAKLLKIEHLLERKPAALSGGQRQRVAIGRAIVRQPKVFLFDEPLSNLDAQLRGEMRAEIKKLHLRLGATIIYVTHDQVEAMTLANQIAVMHGGHVVQYGSPDQIYNQPQALFVAGFMGSPAMNLMNAQIHNGQLQIGDQALPMDASRIQALARTAHLKLGLRPENCRITRDSEKDIEVRAELVLLEPLGAETLATFKIGEQELTARLAPDFRLAPGATCTLYFDPVHLQFFDADSGQTL